MKPVPGVGENPGGPAWDLGLLVRSIAKMRFRIAKIDFSDSQYFGIAKSWAKLRMSRPFKVQGECNAFSWEFQQPQKSVSLKRTQKISH